MEDKYIKFYQSFDKRFHNKKSNSLFCSSQSLLNKERFLGLSKITKQKNRTFSKVLCLKNNYNQHTCK